MGSDQGGRDAKARSLSMSIEALKEQARGHEQREEWTDALQLYLQAISRLGDEDPDMGLFNRAGDLFTRVGNLEGAIEYYEQAVDLYLDAELANNAIAILKKVLRNVPDRKEVYLKMGQIRAQQGFLPDAREYFLGYAERMQKAGDLEEAFRALREFADLAPEDLEIRFALAAQLQTHEREDEALALLTSAYHRFEASGNSELSAKVEERIRETDPEYEIPEASEEDVLGFESTSLTADSKDEGEGSIELASDFGDIQYDEDSDSAIDTGGLALEHTSLASPAEAPAEEAASGLSASDFGVPDDGGRGLKEHVEATDEAVEIEAALPEIDLGEEDEEAVEVWGAATSWSDEDDAEEEEVTELPLMDFDTPSEEDPDEGGRWADADASIEPEETPSDFPAAGDTDVTHAGLAELEAPDDLAELDEPELIGVPGVDAAPLDSELSHPLSDPPSGSADVLDEFGAYDEVEETTYAGESETPVADVLESYGDDAIDSEIDAFTVADDSFVVEEDAFVLENDAPGAESSAYTPDDDAFAAGDDDAFAAGDDDAFAAADDELWKQDEDTVSIGEDAGWSPEEALEESMAAPADWGSGFGEDGGALDAVDVSESEVALDADIVSADSMDEPDEDDLAEIGTSAGLDELPIVETEVPDDQTGNREEASGFGGGAAEAVDSQDPAQSTEYVDLNTMVFGAPKEKTTRWNVEAEVPEAEADFDFQQMLAQFKEKVAENVEAGDVKAHYDLGTAYKEMGLLNEAITEFQQALRADGRNLATYEVLGQCFMEKGQPEVAVRSLTMATELPFEVEDELLGIYYYLGRAHETLGNSDKAVEFYEKVFALDINFQDVTERLRELR